MSDMYAIPVLQFVAAMFCAFLYGAMKAQDRANLWRKIACYAGAMAVGIETKEPKYREYKQQMNLSELQTAEAESGSN